MTKADNLIAVLARRAIQDTTGATMSPSTSVAHSTGFQHLSVIFLSAELCLI